MKVRIMIAAAVAAALLSSCFSPISGSGATGSVSVTLPSLAEAGLSASATTGEQEAPDKRGREYFARVFVYQKGSQAAFGEVPVSSDRPETLTIKGIPEGDGYALAVTIGRKANEALFPERYGSVGVEDRETFSITGGRITPVPVRVRETPFVYAFPGIPLRGLARDNVADGQRAFVTATAKEIIAIPLPYKEGEGVFVQSAGFEVYSVDQGIVTKDQELAWASGPKNVLRRVDFDFDTNTFTQDDLVPPEAIEPAQTILSAAGYVDGTGNVVAMFQSDGGLGGGLVGSEPPPWGNTGEELREYVKGQPVYDVAVYSHEESPFGMFATRFGAFAADLRLFNEIESRELTKILLTGENLEKRGLTFIELVAKRSVREITAIEAYEKSIFLGTAMGVFEARGDFPPLRDGRFSADRGDARLIEETAGMQVIDLALHVDDDGNAFLAALGRSMLVIKNLSTGAAIRLPVVAGVPGLAEADSAASGVTGMTFLAEESKENGVYLGFAGEFGFATIQVR